MLISVILIFFVACGDITRSQEERSYSVEIESYEISTQYGQKYIDWDTLGLKKKGRNKFVVAGTFSLNRNLANEQKINIQVYSYYKDKQIKGPIVYNLQKEVCKYISEDQSTYPGLMEKSNLPSPDTCPVLKNEYTIKDYELNADFLPENIPRGDYFVVFLLKEGMTPVAGFTCVITITD